MTRIRFFTNAQDRLQSAAAWIAQAYRERRQVLIFAPAPDVAEQIDRMLWTQPATGFIPHCAASASSAAETPVLIAGALDDLPQDKCLLNLSNEVPPGFSRFEEVVEIVSVRDEDRLPARDRFRFYRERGYALESRDISEGT
ncbi:DNA polymerase III subunit chi [Rhodocyclaceae bacterium]|nr:DNA polymerase III subunit chi [Rhodocyclaceae bacterium]